MSNSAEKPWSDNPNAPQIPHILYFAEKASFAGALIGIIFYGIVIVLFFQCVGALLSPANRMKAGIRWVLVAHAVTMFLFITIPVTMNVKTQLVDPYINNREFPGGGASPPGPLGYVYFTYFDGINKFPKIMFPLNQWLADGLLLYRCHIIYATNHRVTAFPCVIYLATIATGIYFIYQNSQPPITSEDATRQINSGISYISISVSLNIILTLMISIRLILHSRNIRGALGASAGPTNGLYTAIIATLVESSAPYAVALILYLGPWAANSPATNIFTAVIGDIQVIAPFLITLRVANRRALTNEAISSGNLGSIHFKTGEESTHGEETPSEETPESSAGTDGAAPEVRGVGAGYEIDEVPLSQGQRP